MSKNEKIVILVLVLITIVVTFMLITRNKGEEVQNVTPEQNVANEEFVNLLQDGTKQNTSSKLAETKIVDGLKISNIRLTESGNKSLILADVTNTTNQVKEEFSGKIKILDKAGNTIDEIGAYLGRIAPGGTTTLNAAGTSDFANAYDIVITKNK